MRWSLLCLVVLEDELEAIVFFFRVYRLSHSFELALYLFWSNQIVVEMGPGDSGHGP